MTVAIDNRRIAYLSLEAPREGQATYTHVFEIVNGLREQGCTVDLYIPRYAAGENPGLLRKAREYIWLQYHLLRSLKHFDLVYIRAHNIALPVAFVARIRGVPVIHEVNGSYFDILVTYRWMRPFKMALRWLQRSQYLWSDALIAVTPQLQKWLRDQGYTRIIEVIPNGANLTLFHPRREVRRGLPRSYVVFFGGFARWQGIHTMIEATSSPRWPDQVYLVFVGDGQLTRVVKDAAASCANIRYLGKLSYAEVASVVVGALASLVPKSLEEDCEKTGILPIKLFETLACGVPAIVTDYPGQADLVRSAACGVVIAPDNSLALATAVASLADRPDIAAEMGQRGHTLIARECSWQARSKQTASLIEGTLEAAQVRRAQRTNI